jgi:hypothetical protein
MSLTFNDTTVMLEGLIAESDIIPLRDYLMQIAPQELQFNTTDCSDMHMSIIQLLGAYKTTYGATFSDLSQRRAYEIALANFDV